MDPIADMINALKNAGNAGRESLVIPQSKIKEAILDTLKKERFIKGYSKKTEKKRPVLVVDLILENRIPKINGVQRISKNSKRIYMKSGEMRPVRQGYGVLVVSTPKGVMSGKDARREKVGGEALFKIW